jgi:hypothetical protein
MSCRVQIKGLGNQKALVLLKSEHDFQVEGS